MGIPAAFSQDPVTVHHLVFADCVFQGSGQNVMDSRTAVGGGGTLIKDKVLLSRPVIDGLLQQIHGFPLLWDGIFAVADFSFY